jgi:GNAT superfamily N-acetyltransferase
MRLRPASPADADGLAATVAEGFASYREFAPPGWAPPDPLEVAIGIAVRLRDPDMRAWLVEDDDGGVAGQVSFLPAAKARRPLPDPTVAHLGQLFVRRARWGTGLACALLDHAATEAAAAGYRTMRLFTPAGQARARRFYEREGWTVHGAPVLEDSIGLDLLEYRRPLDPGGP